MVRVVTNWACAIWRLVMPSAAISTTLCSVAVSASIPLRATRRGRAPLAKSSVRARAMRGRAAQAWASSPLAPHCLRVMIELGPDGDTETADDLLEQIRRAESPAPVLLHGLDDSCWPLLAHAGERGVQTRIGLEDTVLLPDGSAATDNAELVAAAFELLRTLSR